MARSYEFTIGRGEAGMRLDQHLSRRLPIGVSRAMIQRAIRDGQVMIRGRPAKVHQRLQIGDRIEASFTALPARSAGTVLTPQEIPLEIVYEDAQLLVVNKPPGLVTHPAPGHWDGTLVNAILWHLGEGQGAGDKGRGKDREASDLSTPHAPRPVPLVRAGIVHRLDKDTSGLLIVAKTEASHVALSRQLKARTIRRRYLAVADGVVPMDSGTITVPIGRHLRHRKEMSVRHLGGRAAVTHYRVLKRFPHPATAPHGWPATALELSLETGRTHQIRVHLMHLGYPVMGDAMYGKRPAGFWQAMGVSRQLLHAAHLSFRHPVTQQTIALSAPVPDDMKRWMDFLPQTS
ncbi:MAG: RNA pseudouridine synthase [Candidatus Omnitrophica bacterium CG11_big_fil_rev_8_21_14_0_20_63_9]|nr:MAG: RNA pseudouridine synthase [Candidatus Omnitrophica bacterium CG11_big_fil_rev_8_21_14_0_20_63_9]